MSLRRRIILLAAGAVAVAICLAAVGSYVAVRSELRGQVDDLLTANADILERAAGSNGIRVFERRLPDRIERRLPRRLRRTLVVSRERGDPPAPPGRPGF